MIINSLLDNDFYKFSMCQAVFHQYPAVQVEYEFKCRNNIKWTTAQAWAITSQLEGFCSLSFSKDELDYLSKLPFIKPDFIDFLQTYRPNGNHYSVKEIDGGLKISVKGPWYQTIFFEVPLLAIVSEVYTHSVGPKMESGISRLNDKVRWFKKNSFPLVDFGTRRRANGEIHREAVRALCENPNFLGTSNVMLAKGFDVPCIGTQAHEWIMAHQQLVPLRDFQKAALDSWIKEYGTDLSIALTDTVGIGAFLSDFGKYYATVFSGLRQDSGDPDKWAGKVINHYTKLGIDSRTKTLVFSDGLDFNKAYLLYSKYKGVCLSAFGIGTYLTNDVEGLTPPNIVMKLTKVNGQPVAKISDSPGKGMCNSPEFVAYLKSVFNVS